MEYTASEQTVGIKETIYEGAMEQPVDADITLPDYCADVQRILKCIVTPNIHATATTGDRLSVEGASCVRVLYVGENGALCAHEQSYAFSQHTQVKGLEEGMGVTVTAAVSYVNCRAVSSRRVDVHGMVALPYTVERRREETVLTDAAGAGVQTRQKTKQVADITASLQRAFTLSEVLELTDSQAAVGQMLQTCAAAVAQEVKAVSNKLLIKGELLLRMLYLAQAGEVASVQHSIPISQIIEAQGVQEGDEPFVCLQITSVEVTPKADTTGTQTLLDINARVCAKVLAYQERGLPVITDAYSTQSELLLEQKKLELLGTVQAFADTLVAKGTVDLSGVGVAQILELWCGEVQQTVHTKGNELHIDGTAVAHLLYRNTDGQPGYLERPVDFAYQRALDEAVEGLACEPSVQILGCAYTMGTDDNAQIRIELAIAASVFTCEPERIIAAIAPDTDTPKAGNTSALTIYFSDDGEDVWEIARRYNTTVEAIRRENGLAADTITGKQMLLIPMV